MVINVTQLNNYLNGLIEIDAVLSNVSVCGEITNVKRSRDGWYFSLKDENSAIDCFCYLTCGNPVAGQMIVADGKINFWTKSGKVSLFIRKFSLTQKNGAAFLRFLELKEKLQKEGLFDDSCKKPIPSCCLKIGVVTSATGAVIHDIENVVHRRQPFSDIILFPVKVQGEGADVEIAKGIFYFRNSDVDVVIVGRGGGSNEDLSAFNSEVVVREVAGCTKPIVSAVGHGLDFTLCDFAADRRAVTPSEAAEFVTIDSALAKNSIVAGLNRLSSLLLQKLKNHKNATTYAANRISTQLFYNIDGSKNTVRFFLTSGVAGLQSRLEKLRSQTEKSTVRLSAANPANILARGYAYVEADCKKIFSVSQVKQGDELSVTVSDGMFNAVVTKLNLTSNK